MSPYLVFYRKKWERELFNWLIGRALNYLIQSNVEHLKIRVTSVPPVGLAATVVLVLVAICTLRLPAQRRRAVTIVDYCCLKAHFHKTVADLQVREHKYIISFLLSLVSPSGYHCVHILAVKQIYTQNLKQKTVTKQCFSHGYSALFLRILFHVARGYRFHHLPEDGTHHLLQKCLKSQIHSTHNPGAWWSKVFESDKIA